MSDVHEAVQHDRETHEGLEDLVLSAREIKKVLKFTAYADILYLLVRHRDDTCTLLHVTFDHTKLNATDVCRIFKKYSKENMGDFSRRPHAAAGKTSATSTFLCAERPQFRIRFLE
jgi:hypothetical protein